MISSPPSTGRGETTGRGGCFHHQASGGRVLHNQAQAFFFFRAVRDSRFRLGGVRMCGGVVLPCGLAMAAQLVGSMCGGGQVWQRMPPPLIHSNIKFRGVWTDGGFRHAGGHPRVVTQPCETRMSRIGRPASTEEELSSVPSVGEVEKLSA